MKIFCIGFQKTGTTSMGAALRELGYTVAGAQGSDDPRIAELALDIVEELVPRFDAFQDNPWAILYEHLDNRFPGSKFILTVREPRSWLASVIKRFGGSSSPMREWIYGYGDPRGHEQEYLERYLYHNQDVLGYFEGREGRDFLVMDLGSGDGWSKLCPFLAVPVVEGRPFPHRNSSREKLRMRAKVNRHMRKLGRRLTHIFHLT